MMLDAAFTSWASKINEREFDKTFLYLLRAQGFYDIHFTHGPYEFGKDFIAKRNQPNPTQFAFQSKSGDIGGSEWSEIYSQLSELPDASLSHPNYDASLPRVSVLVTTGRLKGKAILSARSFQESLAASNRGDFQVWDIDRLLELLKGTVEFTNHPSNAIISLAANIEGGDTTDPQLEDLFANLLPSPPAGAAGIYRSFLDTAVCVNLLLQKRKPFQALTASLNLLRFASAYAHDNKLSTGLFEQAIDFHLEIGNRVVEAFLQKRDSPECWLGAMGGLPGQIITYPVACLRVIEFLGLASLFYAHRGDLAKAREYAFLCAEVARYQPGCTHPISDRYAVSLAPAVIASKLYGEDEIGFQLIKETTKWLCSKYGPSKYGLAGPYSSPQDEVAHLLGVPFQSVDLQPRQESLLASMLADLSYVFYPDLYPLVVNDIYASHIMPSIIFPRDEPAAYFTRRNGTNFIVNIEYPDTVSSDLLPHHRRQLKPRVPEEHAGAAGMVALACLLRDRFFSDCYPRFLRC